jgi:transcriptional regulator with XRE-family HTH domain
MQLTEWLAEKAIDKEEFAKRVGATPEAVRLWTSGARIPNRHFMRRIREATDEAVQPNDFFQEDAA